jgi:hypothetical protein
MTITPVESLGRAGFSNNEFSPLLVANRCWGVVVTSSCTNEGFPSIIADWDKPGIVWDAAVPRREKCNDNGCKLNPFETDVVVFVVTGLGFPPARHKTVAAFRDRFSINNLCC